MSATNDRVLLVTEQQIKEAWILEKNIQPKLLKSTIWNTQNVKVKKILRPTLYNQLLQAIVDKTTNNTPISDDLKTLWIEYVQPYLIHQTCLDFVLLNHYKSTNKGLQRITDGNSTSASSDEVDEFRGWLQQNTQNYRQELEDFLKDNGLLLENSNNDYGKSDMLFDSFGLILEENGGSCGTSNDFDSKKLEETDPVWNSEKSNYYTSTQVDQLIGSMSVAAPSLHSVTSVGNTTSNAVYINGTFSAGFDYGSPRLYIDETSFVIDTGQSTIYSYKAFNNIDSSLNLNAWNTNATYVNRYLIDNTGNGGGILDLKTDSATLAFGKYSLYNNSKILLNNNSIRLGVSGINATSMGLSSSLILGSNIISLSASNISLNIGSDATGDIYYRNSSGNLNRLSIGTAGQVLGVTNGVPFWRQVISDANIPLYLDENNAININPVSSSDDGYLTIEDYELFKSSSLWGSTNYAGFPIIYPYNTSNNLYLENGILLRAGNSGGTSPAGSTIWENIFGTTRAYLTVMGSSDQSVAIGSRGLAQRKVDGLWNYTGIGQSVAIGEYALGNITSGIENTAVGKAAGFNVTSGSRNTHIGSNRAIGGTGSDNTYIGRGSASLGNSGGNNNIAIGSGIWPLDLSADNQLNIGNWIYGANGIITIPSLAGSGTRMVVVNNNGLLSTQTIPSGSGSGISSINGSTSSTQTLVVGATGNDFNIDSSTASGIHIFNLPDASATARGLVTVNQQIFSGAKIFVGGIQTNGSTTNSTFIAAGGNSIGVAAISVEGSANTHYRIMSNGLGATLTANNSYGGLLLSGSALTEASTGTHPLIAAVTIKQLPVTNAGATTSNTATLYVEGALTGITPTGGSYAIWSKEGNNRFGGNVLIDNTSNGISVFNTSDQVTNVESADLTWSGNILLLRTSRSGTGAGRALRIQADSRSLTLDPSNSTSGKLQYTHGGYDGAANSRGLVIAYGINSTSGIQSWINAYGDISQSGSAGYRGLYISPQETSTGSGVKNLIDVGTNVNTSGSGTHSSKFFASSTGQVGINVTTGVNVSSAILQINSATQGVLLPRLTAVQKESIVGATAGLIIYQTDSVPGLYVHNGATWSTSTGGSTTITVSGTYSPVLTNIANVSSSTSYTAMYSRVGDIVNVSGKVLLSTIVNALTILNISLPIPSYLVTSEDCAGNAATSNPAINAWFEAGTASKVAQLRLNAPGTGTEPFHYNFTYRVISSEVAKFNLAASNATIPDWVTVYGQPHLNVLTGTDNRSGSAITISSVTASYWYPFANTTSSTSGETVANPTFAFPSTVTQTYWFTQTNTYTPGQENVQFSGLNPAKTYRFELLGSRDDNGAGTSSRVTVYSMVDNVGTESKSINVISNTANLIVFSGKVPTSGGIIKLNFYAQSAGDLYGYLNGVVIVEES